MGFWKIWPLIKTIGTYIKLNGTVLLILVHRFLDLEIYPRGAKVYSELICIPTNGWLNTSMSLRRGIQNEK